MYEYRFTILMKGTLANYVSGTFLKETCLPWMLSLKYCIGKHVVISILFTLTMWKPVMTIFVSSIFAMEGGERREERGERREERGERREERGERRERLII